MEETIEANVIFAVRPQNIRQIPKVISLLGKMRVILALPPKETPKQYLKCGEWLHKMQNCAKRQQCFHCSSGKYDTDLYMCMEKICVDQTVPCPHSPRCIVCNGLHIANYENCTLRPTYSKAKGAITRRDKTEVVRIRGQQRVARDRLIRDNFLQIETARHQSNPVDTTSDSRIISGGSNSLNDS